LNEDEPDDPLERIKRLAIAEAFGKSPEEVRAVRRNLHEAIQEATERYLAFAYGLVDDLKTLSRHLQVSADILHASQLPAHKNRAAAIRRTVEALAIRRRDRLETILATLPPPTVQRRPPNGWTTSLETWTLETWTFSQTPF
jgi:uncharacterized tellurite resistance protein B-like protein